MEDEVEDEVEEVKQPQQTEGEKEERESDMDERVARHNGARGEDEEGTEANEQSSATARQAAGRKRSAADRTSGGRRKKQRSKLALPRRQADKKRRKTTNTSNKRRGVDRLSSDLQQGHSHEGQDSQEQEDETVEDEWEVEAVVDSRKDRRGRKEYRLKWKRVEEDSKEAGEEEADGAEEGGDDQSYSWVQASDCHCDELIAEYERLRLQQRARRQQHAAPVGVLIEVVEEVEVESYQTAILIEDVTAVSAIDGSLSMDDSSGGVVEESEGVTGRVTEEGEVDHSAGERAEQRHGGYDKDEMVASAASSDSPPAASSATASLSSSASLFMRRSVSPMVNRVSAVLSAFHRAPTDSIAQQSHAEVEEELQQ